MRLPDVISLSTRMFKTRPMRTFLTVLGVGVGIGTVLFLVSLGYGLQNIILNRIATADSLLTLDVNPGPSEALRLDEDALAVIKAIPDVEEVSRLKSVNAQFTIGNLTSNGQLSAIDASFFRLKGIVTSYGELPEQGDVQSAVISSAQAALFNLKPEEIVGRKMDLTILLKRLSEDGTENTESVERPIPYQIAGVIEDENQSYAYVFMQSIADLDIHTYDQLKVRVQSTDVMEQTRNILLDRGYIVSALSDTIEEATKVFRVIQTMLGLFGLVALVVSAIGMFNTMTITLLERINEIGIMRAIGFRRRDIRALFLVESMLMGFLGGLGGVLLGVLAGKIANLGLNFVATRFGGSAFNLFYTPGWFVSVIIIFSTCIGFLTGVYPSRRASRLNPLDALRYK